MLSLVANPMRNIGGTLFSALLLVLLAACSAATTESTQLGLESDDAQNSQPEASAEPSAAPEASETQSPDSTSPPEACSSELQDKIELSITSQTKAFATEDFELAYSFASPSFRANVNLQAFIQVIQSSYGPLISTSELQFADCYSSQTEVVGVIDVRFVEGGSSLYALRYFVVATEEGWRVEGASNLELVASGS